MKLPKNRESGQALIMALILLALGGLLVVPGLNLASTSLSYHQLIEGKTLESYSADSGVQYALTKLYNNPGGYTETPLELSFNLNDRTANVTGEYMGGGIYKITSTATSDNGRSTTIVAYINLSAGAFAYAVASKESMSLEDITVDTLPEDPGGANIHSNTNISLNNCEIYGDATAVGSISGGVVYGMPIEGSSEVAFPGDYSQLYKTMAQEGGEHPGDLTITSDRSLGPTYISGNLTILSANVTLEGTVYVTGTILVENGRLDGAENVVAEGNVTIEAGGYGGEVIPIITSVYGDITLEGPIVDAVVYAPNGTVYLEAVHLYGAVGGRTVTVQYWSIITYAKELHGRQDLPGSELATIAYSFN